MPPGSDQGVTYTPLLEAAGELARRRAIGLHRRVETWWDGHGWPLPPFLGFHQERPLGLLERPIAAANYEGLTFDLMARVGGFDPVWIEFKADRLTFVNPLKQAYAKAYYILRKGRNGGHQVRKVLHVSEEEARNRPIFEIRLADGGCLADKHHNHQNEIMGRVRRVDASDNLLGVSPSPRGFYSYKLSWALAHAILVENYDQDCDGSDLADFRRNVFYPAVAGIEAAFGCYKPIIVKIPLLPNELKYPALDGVHWTEHGIVPDERELIRLCSQED